MQIAKMLEAAEVKPEDVKIRPGFSSEYRQADVAGRHFRLMRFRQQAGTKGSRYTAEERQITERDPDTNTLIHTVGTVSKLGAAPALIAKHCNK